MKKNIFFHTLYLLIFTWLFQSCYSFTGSSLSPETKTIQIKDFPNNAPLMNPNRHLITGVICGVRVETIEEPLMRELRYLDKLIDELAKGKSIEKILRK